MRLLSITAAVMILAAGAKAQNIALIDAHSQVDVGVRMEQIVPLMDRAGVARAILAPTRQGANRDLMALAAKVPDRITASIGLKNMDFFKGEASDIERVRRQGTNPQFGALSELLIWHEQKGERAPQVRTDFEATQARTALDIALARRWPMVVHIEFGSTGQRYGSIMAGLERWLAGNREHAFVLSHMGQLKAAEVARLITAHGNIHFLTSHANTVWLQARRSVLPWINLFKGSTLAPEWKDLLMRHPSRFIFALDAVYSDDWGDLYVRQAALWKTALAELPPTVGDAIAHGNAVRLWRLPQPQRP